VIALVGRLHRQFLDVVKLELDRLGIGDINNVQALLLFNIGHDEMSVGELTLRGCYLGSSVSYNVKKLVDHGYLGCRRSLHDRRSINIRLTGKGEELRDRLALMHQRHATMLPGYGMIGEDDLHKAAATLGRLERFWGRVGDLEPRPGQFAA
jgi:DNA-binding MarR family transcriptional regulator